MKQQSAPTFHKKEFWDFGGTLNELNPPTMMPDNHVRKSENWQVAEDGKSRKKRGGYADASDTTEPTDFGVQIRGAFHFKDTAGNLRRLVITSKKIYIEDIGGGNWTEVYYQATGVEEPFKPVTFESGRPIIVGFEKNLYIDTEIPASPAAYQLGIDKPGSAPSVATGAAGNLTGDYKYVITYLRSGNFPNESNPSVESAVVSPSSQKVDLTNIPVSSDPQVDQKRIYRAKANGAILYWLRDIPNANTVYEDDAHDDSLGDEVSYNRYIPPAADDVEVWDGRVWFLVGSEGKIYYTNAGEEAERGNLNFLLIECREPEKLIGMKVFGENLYSFKRNSMFRLDKVGDSYYEPVKLPFRTGCDARGSIVATEDMLIWKSPTGIELFNGNRILRPKISRFIRKTFKTINSSSCSEIFGEINDNDNKYWMTVPYGGAGQIKFIVLDLLTSSFDVFTFHDHFTAFHNAVKSDGIIDFLCGNKDGKLWRYGDAYYSDNGSAISCEFLSKWYQVSSEAEWNNLREMIIKYILKNDGETKKHLTLKVYSNFSDTATLTKNLEGNDVSDSLRNEVIRILKAGVKGAYISFGFSNAEVLVGELKVIGLDGYFQERIIKKDIYGS